MTNTTPIILDRLSAALGTHGVKLRRSQLLDVAASAFGYRNDNAFSAVAKAGELDAPRADPLGVDDRGLLVMRDPTTGAVFAIDPRRNEARADRWCLSPYGGVVDIAGMEASTPVSIAIHTATVTHRHGTNFYVAGTATELKAELAGYCDEWWSDARDRDPSLPETTEGLSNEEIARLYFAVVEEDFVETGTDTLTAPRAVAAAIGTPSGEAWVLCRTNPDDDDEPLLWWNDEDGWGDLACASVHPDTTGRMPMVGDGQSVSWQQLPGATRTTTPTAACLTTTPRWTVTEPKPAMQEAASLLAKQPIEAVPGIVFTKLVTETTPTEAYPSGRRWRTILETQGQCDVATATSWKSEMEATLRRADTTIEISTHRVRIVFDGDADIRAAASAADWLAATRDLVQPVGNRERIMADFRAEAWIRDNAVEVDAQGDPSIDVTYEMLLAGRETASQLTTGDTDYLKEAVRAPTWISDWTGPFTITVADAIAETTLYDK